MVITDGELRNSATLQLRNFETSKLAHVLTRERSRRPAAEKISIGAQMANHAGIEPLSPSCSKAAEMPINTSQTATA